MDSDRLTLIKSTEIFVERNLEESKKLLDIECMDDLEKGRGDSEENTN